MREKHSTKARRRWGAAVAIVAATAAVVVGSAPGQATATGYRITAKASGSVDTTRMAAVNYAYNTRYAPYTNVSTGWTGSVSGCRAGTTSSASHYATLRSINFVRGLNGLGKVAFSSTMNARALKAALLMTANGTLSHYPSTSWRCYTDAGAKAASLSDLAMASPLIRSGRIVDMYMDDPGSGNEAVGHRRWVLYPFTTYMGNGSTSNANALTVVGPTSSTRANPRWTSWPSAGYFPSPLEPNGRWSLSSGYKSENFSRAVVKVWHNGKRLYPTRYAVHNGYGMPTVAWKMPAETSRIGTYKVTVSRITRSGVGTYYSRSYTVRIFKPYN